MSRAEMEFRRKFPYAHVIVQPKTATYPFNRYSVYAGDYLCAEYVTRVGAFKMALSYVRERLIAPDPAEVASHVS